MAKIEKANNSLIDDDNLSLEDLKKEYLRVFQEIKQRLVKNPDMDKMSNETKSKLKVKYIEIANYARKISLRTSDLNEKEEYQKNYTKLIARAQDFGSTIKGRIPKTTLDDVKGLDNVKKIVKSFIYLLQNPQIREYYHIDGGLGMMLYGAPGTGKSMFAEAVANALQLPLFTVTPADIFKSYVGESEQAVRQLFAEIDANQDGAILFVDECESIFSKRTNETKDYKAAVTSEFLQRLNGEGVDGSKRILIAATNRPSIIDAAYLRYKRFSHIVHVGPPDAEAKKAIITSKLKNIPLSGITIDDIVAMSEINSLNGGLYNLKGNNKPNYYSGADISGIVEEACRYACEILEAKRETNPIPLTREMFEKAFAKIKPSISQDVLDEYENFKTKIEV